MIGFVLAIYSEFGHTLKSLGVNNAVLPLVVALDNIIMFENAGYIILGGDILKMDKDGSFDYTYDNWHYEGDSASESTGNAYEYLRREHLHNPNHYVSFTIRKI